MIGVKCGSCMHRDGCYDADTSASACCDHYRNSPPKPIAFDWGCIKKEADNGKNEQ